MSYNKPGFFYSQYYTCDNCQSKIWGYNEFNDKNKCKKYGKDLCNSCILELSGNPPHEKFKLKQLKTFDSIRGNFSFSFALLGGGGIGDIEPTTTVKFLVEDEKGKIMIKLVDYRDVDIYEDEDKEPYALHNIGLAPRALSDWVLHIPKDSVIQDYKI